MFVGAPGQSFGRIAGAPAGMRALSRAEIEAVSGGETVSCIWVCQPVPEPSDPPAINAGFDTGGGGTGYDCQLVCGGIFGPGDDYPSI